MFLFRTQTGCIFTILSNNELYIISWDESRHLTCLFYESPATYWSTLPCISLGVINYAGQRYTLRRKVAATIWRHPHYLSLLFDICSPSRFLWILANVFTVSMCLNNALAMRLFCGSRVDNARLGLFSLSFATSIEGGMHKRFICVLFKIPL